ncbi:MAG: DUF488 domain-containing protein [Methanobacteriota archaeon]
MKIFTLGFTKKSLEDFVELLRRYNVERVVDVRANATSQLAGFAKSRDLEYLLEKLLKIDYIHVKELAPTQELLKRYKKNKDWGEYEKEFNGIISERRIENYFDAIARNVDSICLLCVEDKADHCHRRLIAEYFSKKFDRISIHHLTKANLI